MLIMKEIRPYDPPFPSESQVVLSWRAAPNWRNAGPRRLPVKFVRFAVPKKPWNLQVSVFVTHGVFPQGCGNPKIKLRRILPYFAPWDFSRSWSWRWQGPGRNLKVLASTRSLSRTTAENLLQFQATHPHLFYDFSCIHFPSIPKLARRDESLRLVLVTWDFAPMPQLLSE